MKLLNSEFVQYPSPFRPRRFRQEAVSWRRVWAVSAQALQPGAGFAVAGIDLHGSLVGFDRLGVIVGFFVTESEARPGLRVVRVDIERGVEVVDGGIVFAGGDQALGSGLVWRACERIAID